MRALDRKLLRDLWRLRGQVVAIGMVIASGVAVLIMSLGALEALEQTAAAYYERGHFAHVFADLKRAPERVARRAAELPGVRAVETRISQLALLDVEGFDEPVVGRLLSIPERRESRLNRITLRAGRSVEPGARDEAVVSEAFAEAHGLHPGSQLHALVNGHNRRLEVVGVALSPEFVYAIGPGTLMPDDHRYGVIWMGRETLAAAYDLEGAFNEISLSLGRGISRSDTIARLDELLAPYGGLGAYERADQISNWFLMSEIDQLANMATVLPTIFLAVAAFLTNMVLSRLISVERSEIGLLKAFGYSNASVGLHYAELVVVMAAFGILLGWVLGYWMGWVTTGIYAQLYRFPFFFFRPSPSVFAIASLVSLGSALFGTLGAVRVAAQLPPAEAMRPPAPPLYRKARLAGRFGHWIDQPTRMILRQIARWPGRSAVTVVGVAMAVGLLTTALHWDDAITEMVSVYFEDAQRQDVTVGLVEARPESVAGDLSRLPGVLAAEPFRFVGARLRAGHRSRREPIRGIVDGASLAPVYDSGGAAVPIPREGLLLSTKLAEKLAVERGDLVSIEILEGRRPVQVVPVTGLFETYIGMPAYMHIDALNRLMFERPSANGAHLRVDPQETRRLFRELKKLPVVSAITVRRAAVAKFHETMAETMMIFISFFATFACMLALGVTYNSARVALSERARELATLRVLGMTRREISYILLGEVGLLIWIALPVGCGVGYALAWFLSERFETDLYRVPMVVEPSTFGLAVLLVVVAGAISAALVRRRVDRLDLIAVLKTRE